METHHIKIVMMLDVYLHTTPPCGKAIMSAAKTVKDGACATDTTFVGIRF